MKPRTLCICALVVLSIAAAPRAEEPEPKTIKWSATDTAGKAFNVPAADQVSVLLFVMADQDHSKHAMAYAQQVLAGRDGVQTAAIISGEQAAAMAQPMIDQTRWKPPMLVDAKYEASGAMQVRVWPTTLVVNAHGELIAHIGGCPASYSKDLAAYIDFAAGKIDEATLKQRLADRGIVGSTADDIANRHEELAMRLMERGDYGEARAEIEKGLAGEPNSVKLLLAKARLDIITAKPAEAIKSLDKVNKTDVAPWRINALRGRAMVALGRWQQAEPVLSDALKLNPDPAEAHYALGLVYEHDKQWEKAAAEFRSAFETTTQGKMLVIPAAQP